MSIDSSIETRRVSFNTVNGAPSREEFHPLSVPGGHLQHVITFCRGARPAGPFHGFVSGRQNPGYAARCYAGQSTKAGLSGGAAYLCRPLPAGCCCTYLAPSQWRAAEPLSVFEHLQIYAGVYRNAGRYTYLHQTRNDIALENEFATHV